MRLHIIEADGTLKEVILGTNIENGETFQAIVKSGSWFAASVKDPNSYALVGCTVSPGFNCHDWKLRGQRNTCKNVSAAQTDYREIYQTVITRRY